MKICKTSYIKKPTPKESQVSIAIMSLTALVHQSGANITNINTYFGGKLHF